MNNLTKTMSQLSSGKVPAAPERYEQTVLILNTATAIMDALKQPFASMGIGDYLDELEANARNDQERLLNRLDSAALFFDAIDTFLSDKTRQQGEFRHGGFPNGYIYSRVTPEQHNAISVALQPLLPLKKPIQDQVTYALQKTCTRDFAARWNLDMVSPAEALNYQQSQANNAVIAAYGDPEQGGSVQINIDGKIVHSAYHVGEASKAKPTGKPGFAG